MEHKIQEINVSYSNNSPSTRYIYCSQDAYSLFLECWNKDTIELQEEFKLLLLNKANRLIGIFNLSRGGIDGTVVDVRLLFVTALKTAATGIILAHNHPSGRLYPSIADKILTEKIRKGGETLDIKVLDHLIVTKQAYFSFGDEGL